MLKETHTDKELILEKPLNIMVVDDSVSIRQVVSRLMEDQGWKVLTAKDGIDALDRLSESRPDLIVLDIEMPRMNGYEFLGALKARSGFEEVPVVMLTSRTATKHRDKAKALGAKGFIVKPYHADELVRLILNLTGKGSEE
jgi:chemosensory pili system protein ChpA (sensor histidine kinase/response regulator)